MEKELKKAHARGVVIGAATDGAALLGDRGGLGLLPGFAFGTSKQTEAVLRANPACVGLSFGDGAALVIRGRVGRVIGDS